MGLAERKSESNSILSEFQTHREGFTQYMLEYSKAGATGGVHDASVDADHLQHQLSVWR